MKTKKTVNVTANKEYVVYEFNNILGNNEHLSLKRIEFSSWKIRNGFKTEDEAIQALIDDDKTYENYVILLQVYIN